LEDVWFAIKKQKTVLNVAANAKKYETNAQFCRILVIPFRRSAGDIFDLYLANLTTTYKVKGLKHDRDILAR
jgi:hypothetical protein